MNVLQDFEYIDVDVWDKSSKECKEYNAKVHPHASIPALELQKYPPKNVSLSPRFHDHIRTALSDSFSPSTNHFALFFLMTLYGLCHSNDVKIQNFQLNTQYLYSEL
jgi:hypothetical protein